MYLANILVFWHALLDELFPSECLGCHKEGKWLCDTCQRQSYLIKTPTCPFCDRLSPLGKTCARCRATHKLTGGRSVWYYKPPINTFIHALKYRRITSAQTHVTPYLAALIGEIPLPKHQPVVITSVPVTKQKLSERGFNQSEILAQAVARQVGIPYVPLLIRTANAPSQTTLTRKERLVNTQHQFRIRKYCDITNHFIIVIDDVITTGATLSSSATALKTAGARQVWGVTVAKD